MIVNPRACVGAALITAVSALFYVSALNSAEEKISLQESILRIAAALERGDVADARSRAGALAPKVEVDELFRLMAPRRSRGLGVARKPRPRPDSIEMMLNKLGRDPLNQATVEREAEDLETMAYRVAAIAEVTLLKSVKGIPQANWAKFSNDLRAAAPGLAKAARTRNPNEIQNAVVRINASCNDCHSEF